MKTETDMQWLVRQCKASLGDGSRLSHHAGTGFWVVHNPTRPRKSIWIPVRLVRDRDVVAVRERLGVVAETPKPDRPAGIYINGCLAVEGSTIGGRYYFFDGAEEQISIKAKKVHKRFSPEELLYRKDDIELLVCDGSEETRVRGRVVVARSDDDGTISSLTVVGMDKVVTVYALHDVAETPKPDPSIAGLALAADDDGAGHGVFDFDDKIEDTVEVLRFNPGMSIAPIRPRDRLQIVATITTPEEWREHFGAHSTPPDELFNATKRATVVDLNHHTRNDMLSYLERGSSPHCPDDHGPCRCQLCDACGAGPWETSEANRWLERRGRDHAGVATGLWAVVSGKRGKGDGPNGGNP